MDDKKRIALFVDVDNLQLNINHIDSLLSRLEMDGEIVCGKFYGVVDRKYKDIVQEATNRGFDISVPMRNKKRGGKSFDTKILIDVMELIYSNATVDAVAIISQPADLVHLFSKLKKEDIEIFSVDFLDEDCLAFVDQVIYFGYEGPEKAAPRIKAARTSAPKAPKAPKKDEEELDVLKDIQKLKQSAPRDSSFEDTAVVDQITAILENFKELDI